MSLFFSELIHTQQKVKLFRPAFSSPVIWSVIFQVLHFPGLAFSVVPNIWVEQGCSAVFSRKTAISLKRGKIGTRLLLTTNRKLHTHFQLVPKSITLNDPELPLCTLFQNACVFGAHHENFNEDRLILSAVTVVSGNIRFTADIRGGSLETRRQTTVGWSKTLFRAFGHYVFDTLGNQANFIV